MKICRVNAIFDEFRLNNVKNELIRHGVTGFTLFTVRGRGYYFDRFNEQHLIKHVEMEIYANADQADRIAELIVDVAHVNAEGEGLVSITPVDKLYWIHDKRAANNDDFRFYEQ